MQQEERTYVIGCGVMQLDFEAAARDLGLQLGGEFLEAGLHSDPGELRRQLQAAVDRASDAGKYDRVVILYGLCGRGVVGLQAGAIPLVLPKVHDCISLFLGSDAAYREQFSKCPGTYYISAGWFETKVQPRGEAKETPRGPLPPPDFERFREQYGEDNAHAIVAFLGSWKRNYKRAVFIDTGCGEPEKYESYARAMAAEFGWRYECLPGNRDLVEKMLLARQGSKEILWVPPGHTVRHDPLEGAIGAAAPWHEAAAEGSAPPAAPQAEAAPKRVGVNGGTRLGLGIDAGGTYTDAVVYDFREERLLSKGKALTTRWDYTVGIDEAVAMIDPEHLPEIDLVAISTTLATNAIVENSGQTVALLLMPPGGRLREGQIEHQPTVVIRGRMDIAGNEIEAPDAEEVKAVAQRLQKEHGVAAFAVSGYGGAVNAAHENLVKQTLRDIGAEAVVCGHELSDQLNFHVRANTAVLNACIIPLLRRFLAQAGKSLRGRGIEAPIVVVKGDGSLISTAVAEERPIETVLSGPAASVSGARYLTGIEHATIIDIGGTTSDLARVNHGEVCVRASGARIGGWRTHVRALDMCTTGLGGDSVIHYEKQQPNVGPIRVTPVSWLLSAFDGAGAALDYLETRLDDFAASTRPMEIAFLSGRTPEFELEGHEAAILEALAERPHSLPELARRAGCSHWRLLQLDRLEAAYLVQRCGLTPTDLWHTLGQLELWDREAARRLTRMYATLAGETEDGFAKVILRQVSDALCVQLFQRQLGQETNAGDMAECTVCQALTRNLLGGGNGEYKMSLALNHPVIGLGAPAHFFLPAAVERLDAELVIPEHADVANAIGAITSSVTVSKRVRIQPTETGVFAVLGLNQAMAYASFEEAHQEAVAKLGAAVKKMAREAGTSESAVQVQVNDRLAPAADGSEVFVERILNARISGPPDAINLANRP